MQNPTNGSPLCLQSPITVVSSGLCSSVVTVPINPNAKHLVRGPLNLQVCHRTPCIGRRGSCTCCAGRDLLEAAHRSRNNAKRPLSNKLSTEAKLTLRRHACPFSNPFPFNYVAANFFVSRRNKITSGWSMMVSAKNMFPSLPLMCPIN